MRWAMPGAVLTAAYLPYAGAADVWFPQAPQLLEAGVFLLLVLASATPVTGIVVALGMLGSGIYGMAAEGQALSFVLTLLAVTYPYTAILSVRALCRKDERSATWRDAYFDL